MQHGQPCVKIELLTYAVWIASFQMISRQRKQIIKILTMAMGL